MVSSKLLVLGMYALDLSFGLMIFFHPLLTHLCFSFFALR
jgi:hypothetical protein